MSIPDEASSNRTCATHGVPTLLRCAQCDKPICPKCTVWTPVGQKCGACTPQLRRAKGKYDRFIRPGVVVGILLLVLGVIQFLNSDSVQRSSSQFGAAASTTTAPPVAIGEEGTNSGVVFQVSRFECGPTEVGAGPVKRSAIGRFCSLSLKVRNAGAAPVGFNGAGQFLRDSAGNSYAVDPRATAAASMSPGRDLGTTQQLNPGISLEAVLVFDVPETTVPTEADLHGAVRGLQTPTRAGGGLTVRLTPAT